MTAELAQGLEEEEEEEEEDDDGGGGARPLCVSAPRVRLHDSPLRTGNDAVMRVSMPHSLPCVGGVPDSMGMDGHAMLDRANARTGEARSSTLARQRNDCLTHDSNEGRMGQGSHRRRPDNTAEADMNVMPHEDADGEDGKDNGGMYTNAPTLTRPCVPRAMRASRWADGARHEEETYDVQEGSVRGTVPRLVRRGGVRELESEGCHEVQSFMRRMRQHANLVREHYMRARAGRTARP